MRSFVSSLCVCAAIVSSAAFDENTIAFYSFNGKTAGESALGSTVENKVDSTKYGITIYQMAGGTRNAEILADGGQAYWSADRPGKYVFAKRGYKSEVIATDPVSLNVQPMNNNRGAQCAFASLASDLGDQPEWTVEWFWKLPQNYAGFFQHGWFSLPLWTTDKSGNPASALMVSTTPSGNGKYFRLYASGEQTTVGAGLAYCGTNPLCDGLWHHIAVSYKNGNATLTVDYSRATTTVPMSIASTNEAVALLMPANGSFHGQVSCIRVTKKALPASEYMAATDYPDCYPRTAFHWSLDGVVGTEADGIVSNRAYVAAEYANFNTNLYGSAVNGLGRYSVDTNGNRAVYTNLYPNGANKRVVREGDRKLGVDESSLYLDTTPLNLSESTTAVLWTSGTSITATNCCPPITGSFTMEMFARINFNEWRTNTYYVSRKRTTLMGQMDVLQGSRYYNWSLEVSPSTNGGSLDGFKINAYNSALTLVSTSDLLARFSYLRGWHHIAVTYDETDYTMRLYVDYAQVGGALSLGNPLLVGNVDGHAYSVGGGLNNHSFDGWVDEVRLVRECLTPDKFLRLEREPGMALTVK